ncbi:MAG TPA: hypothetical protein VI318_11275 [Baekduia sp.]
MLIYRRFTADLRQWVRHLRDAGVGVIWDNDDDFLHMPRNRQNKRHSGGRSSQQIFTEMVQIARLADQVLVTTEPLAGVMADAGVRRVHVIPNQLAPGTRTRRPHADFTIGWIAGDEHRPDAQGVDLHNALSRLMEKHPNLTVTTVGVELHLRERERYRHTRFVPFEALPEVIAEFDIGIAPLLDTPFNRSRSDIKVKEYAGFQVPWVASPHGPYAPLGEEQGGRLAADDAWFDVLDGLVADPDAQRRLAAAGAAWASTQTFDAVADEYEQLLATVAAKASGRPIAVSSPPPPTSAAKVGARLPRGLRRRRQPTP